MIKVLAMRYYACSLMDGYGISIDKEEAFKYFKMGADNGDAICIHKAGLMYINSDGTTMNKNKAKKLLKNVADNESVDRMLNYVNYHEKQENHYD